MRIKFEKPIDDVEIKNEEELKEAKLMAGVRSHERVLQALAAEQARTGDRSSYQNTIDSLKDAAVAEFILRQEQSDEKNKKPISEEGRVFLDDKIKQLAVSDAKLEEWLVKRAEYLASSGNSVERIAQRLEYELETDKEKPTISFIEQQGVVQKIIQSRADLFRDRSYH